MDKSIRVTSAAGQFLVKRGIYSRRYLGLDQILEELYNTNGTDLDDVLKKLDEIEKRIERIENFCNSLADSIAPLEAFR